MPQRSDEKGEDRLTNVNEDELRAAAQEKFALFRKRIGENKPPSERLAEPALEPAVPEPALEPAVPEPAVQEPALEPAAAAEIPPSERLADTAAALEPAEPKPASALEPVAPEPAAAAEIPTPSERLADIAAQKPAEEIPKRKPQPPPELPKIKPYGEIGRSNRYPPYQGEDINLENFEMMVDELKRESFKLFNTEELLDKLKIKKNGVTPEKYKNITSNSIDNYDKVYIMLVENIKIFLENKKQIDEM